MLSGPMPNLYDMWSGIKVLHNKPFLVAMGIEMEIGNGVPKLANWVLVHVSAKMIKFWVQP